MGLGHRIATGEVMNYSISPGATLRTPSAIEFAGAYNKLAYSSAASCFNPSNSGTPMISANNFMLTSAAGTDAQTKAINTAITAITYSNLLLRVRFLVAYPQALRAVGQAM